MVIQAFIATHSKHLASHIERKAKYGGLSAVAVEPTAEALLARVGESEACIVVIDALQKEEDALAIVNVLSESRPKAKAVILGRNPDLALVARGIVAGVSQFLLESTPADEFAKAVADLVAGKQPSEESLFGRVYGSLPASESKDGWFRTRSGRRLSTENAIKQCDQFGLSVDEIAEYLKVPVSDAERITKKARKVVKPSFLSQIVASLVPGNASRSRERLALYALCIAVAGIVALRIVRPPRASLPYELATITGTVVLDDSPLNSGIVSLIPDNSRATRGPVGSGILDDRGRFSITTAGLEGAVVGKHRVVVQPHSVPLATPSSGVILSTIPPAYLNASTSGLTVEVKSGVHNTTILSLVTPTSDSSQKPKLNGIPSLKLTE